MKKKVSISELKQTKAGKQTVAPAKYEIHPDNAQTRISKQETTDEQQIFNNSYIKTLLQRVSECFISNETAYISSASYQLTESQQFVRLILRNFRFSLELSH